MNDPSQNELLSAYLDGELSADEQAEVERLLAADPAARQLLDDLRALSTTLQALPQERLGEDLTGKVLRTAERRMLLEGAPGEAADAPTPAVPPGRSIFRGPFGARGLAWAGIAVAVAVVIMVIDGQQRAPMDDKGAGDLALATAKPEEPAEENEALPPRIQAFRDGVVESAKPSEAPAEKKADRGAKPPAELPASKSAKKAAPTAEAPSPLSFAAPLAKTTTGKAADQADKKAPVEKEVLVVHCDVTPEAITNKAFDKLLAANGIAWRRQRERRDLDGDTRTTPSWEGRGRGAKQKQQTDAEKTTPPPLASGEVDLIYVEATPEQIEATLAALAARPEAFFNLSVNPAQGTPPARRSLGRSTGGGQARAEAGPAAAGEEPRQKAAAAGGPEKADKAEAPPRGGLGTFGAPSPANALGEAQRIPVPSPGGRDETDANSAAGAEEHEADQSRRETKPKKERQTQPPAQSVPWQRVLFVLRVAGGDHPTAAAARVGVAEQPEAAKSEEQKAPPPADPPTQQK